MGWSIFSERCIKSGICFKVRIERMNDKGDKKVCEHIGVISMWLRTCKREVRKCEMKSKSRKSSEYVTVRECST